MFRNVALSVWLLGVSHESLAGWDGTKMTKRAAEGEPDDIVIRQPQLRDTLAAEFSVPGDVASCVGVLYPRGPLQVSRACAASNFKFDVMIQHTIMGIALKEDLAKDRISSPFMVLWDSVKPGGVWIVDIATLPEELGTGIGSSQGRNLRDVDLTRFDVKRLGLLAVDAVNRVFLPRMRTPTPFVNVSLLKPFADVVSVTFRRESVTLRKALSGEAPWLAKAYLRHCFVERGCSGKSSKSEDHVLMARPLEIRRANSANENAGYAQDSLRELFRRAGTDKADRHWFSKGAAPPHWELQHGYGRYYERLLPELRSRMHSEGENVVLVEIGVNDGRSMRVWQQYFARKDKEAGAGPIHDSGHLYGIGYGNFQESGSIKPCEETSRTAVEVQGSMRCTLVQGDQSDPKFLHHFIELSGGEFDLVIDDGSHLPSHQLVSFENLWPAVRSGGIYIVEDIETSFWRNTSRLYNYSFAGQFSLVEKWKGVVDVLWKGNSVNSSLGEHAKLYSSIESIAFGQNMIILRKKSDAAEIAARPEAFEAKDPKQALTIPIFTIIALLLVMTCVLLKLYAGRKSR